MHGFILRRTTFAKGMNESGRHRNQNKLLDGYYLITRNVLFVKVTLLLYIIVEGQH